MRPLLIAALLISLSACGGSGVPPDKSADSISESIREGDLKRLAELLEADPSRASRLDDGESPVHAASATGSIDAFGLLVKHGADVNSTAREESPLLWALWKAPPDRLLAIVQALLDAGADATVTCSTPGGSALGIVQYNVNLLGVDPPTQVLECLLDAGADVNGYDTGGGYTPLHVAVSNCASKMCAWLIEHGANANIPGKSNIYQLEASSEHSPVGLARKKLSEAPTEEHRQWQDLLNIIEAPPR